MRNQDYAPDPADEARHDRLSSDRAKHFKTRSPILCLGNVSSPINLTSRSFFHIANTEAAGVPHPWHFSSPGNHTPSAMYKKA